VLTFHKPTNDSLCYLIKLPGPISVYTILMVIPISVYQKYDPCTFLPTFLNRVSV
jgi:hypothetical protein